MIFSRQFILIFLILILFDCFECSVKQVISNSIDPVNLIRVKRKGGGGGGRGGGGSRGSSGGSRGGSAHSSGSSDGSHSSSGTHQAPGRSPGYHNNGGRTTRKLNKLILLIDKNFLFITIDSSSISTESAPYLTIFSTILSWLFLKLL